ncbi:MAG: MGMT family protein [Prochlorococcaceae cyanobacterium]|jgi:methylated-DNA-protein-cysteine methyltransferase-like protein
MPSSPFFARIREHVLQLTAAIPEGRVCTFQSVGEYLDVMPRHVAFILSQLEDNEKFVYPWYRVVSGDGSLGRPKTNPDGTSQGELLRAEGILVSGNRIATSLELVFIPAEQLPSGLPKQNRPPDAPVPRSKRTRSIRAR